MPYSSSTPSHTYDAETLSKTRVWGSNEKILLHFRATLLVSEKQHKGCEKCSWKTVVGSGVTYDYDAFGNLIHSTGTTPNNYLFAGEQFDPDLHLYYNRARYLNVSTGRSWSMDTDEGRDQSPLSLHKYLYANANPVNRRDRTGRDDIGELAVAGGISGVEDASAAEADSLALRVFSTLTQRGATFRILGTASTLIPTFAKLAEDFEENEGIVVELQDELFAIR
jgi:RHS repeat-associated protein